MPFLGPIAQATGYSLEIISQTKLALTVINIRRDRISEVESLTFDGNANLPDRPIGTNIGRLVFLANALPNGGPVQVRIRAGSDLFEVVASPDAQFVFDIT